MSGLQSEQGLLRIVEVSADDRSMMEQIGILRVRAWATEVPEIRGQSLWLDLADQHARHWAMIDDTKLVASARMSVHQCITEVPDADDYEGVFTTIPPCPIASLNRLVVAPEARGRGFSTQLDRVRLDAAEQMGCRSVILSTSTNLRLKHFAALGFTIVGDRRQAPVESLGLRPRPGKVLIRFL